MDRKDWRWGVAEALAGLSIGVTVLWGAYVLGVAIAGVEGEVGALGVQVKVNTESIERVERQVAEDQQAIIKRLEDNKQEVRAVRVESAEGRQRIEQKLDRLIEREIERR